jgi:radical SAM protein with 4Fe4S-binding SPASM domain
MTGYADLLARAAAAHTPLEVCLELTHRCTFRCAHCYIPDFTAPDLLPTPRVLALLEELAEAGTLFLTLSGGEVLLRPDWAVVARRARELGFFVVVLSNGFLVDEEAADVLADLPAKVEVSVYSVDEALMDRITGCPGSGRRVQRAVSLLRERGADVVVKTPLMTLNRDAIPAIAAWAETIGVPFRAFPVIVARRDGDPGPLALRVQGEELREFLAGPHYDCGEAGALREADPSATLCAAGLRYCAITPSGDVVACNILPGSAGNVRERSFREVWEGSPWLARIRALRRGDLAACRGCAHQPTCSRCPAQALVETGDLLGPLPAACERAGMVGEILAARAGEEGAPGERQSSGANG